MSRAFLVVVAVLSSPIFGQSLSLVATTDPNVHGSGADSSVVLQFAGSDALYISAFGPGAGVWQTVTRWRPDSGLSVLGSTPYGSGSFQSAVELGGFVYFGANGVWKGPTTGTGSLVQASTSWPASLGGSVRAMATDGASVWFISTNPVSHLGRLDPVTGAVTDFGAPFGGQVFGLTGDASGIYCFVYFPITSETAIYRFDALLTNFSLLTLFPPGTFNNFPDMLVASGVISMVVSSSLPGFAGYALVRVDVLTGAVLDIEPFETAHTFNGGPLSASGTALHFIAVSSGAPFGGSEHVATREANGTVATLVPPPCAFGGAVGFLCTIRAFLRDGPYVHVLTRGSGPWSTYFAVGTFSPTPFAASVASLDAGCGGGASPILTSSAPVLGSYTTLSLVAAPSTPGFLVGGSAPTTPISVGGCSVLVDLFDVGIYPISTTSAGTWTASIACPPPLILWAGIKRRWQTVVFPTGAVAFSNGVEWTFGF